MEIFPPNFPFARSYQTSIGIQRGMGHGLVIQADYARRQGENVSLGEVDRNLYTRYLGSYIGEVFRREGWGWCRECCL